MWQKLMDAQRRSWEKSKAKRAELNSEFKSDIAGIGRGIKSGGKRKQEPWRAALNTTAVMFSIFFVIIGLVILSFIGMAVLAWLGIGV